MRNPSFFTELCTKSILGGKSGQGKPTPECEDLSSCSSCFLTHFFIISGHSSVSADETILCITNLESGCDLYSMPSLQKIRTFPQSITINSQIEGTLALDNLFITGSDDGVINIYDILSGHRVSTLTHSKCESSISAPVSMC